MSSRSVTLAVAVVLTVSGVGSPATAGRSRPAGAEPLVPPAGFAHLGATATATALTHRARRDIGVWSMLGHLRVGVYSVTGRQVLAGSERSASDFWISDAAIPVLARMAAAPKIHFSRYVDYLHSHGAMQSESEVLAALGSAYAQHRDAFLAQLFDALHVQFSGDPAISPLVEWLLLLDTVVSPNNTPAERAAVGHRTGSPMLAGSEPASCDIRGNGRPPGWGIAAGSLPAVRDAFGNAGSVAIQAMLIANAAVVDVNADPGEVHEGHRGPGAVETFRVSANLGVVPHPSGCGDGVWAITGATALSNMVLDWQIDPSEAFQHGSYSLNGPADGVPQPKSDPHRAKSVTNTDGASKVAFRTIEEPSHGNGKRHVLHVRVIVTADVHAALAAQGVDPTLLSYMPAAPIVSLARFVISWHDDSEQWTGTLHATREYADSRTTSHEIWDGTAALTVDAHGNVSGTFDVTGTATFIDPEFGTSTVTDVGSWKLSGERKGNGFVINSVSFGTGLYFDEVVPTLPFTIPMASPRHISTALKPMLPGGELQIELTCQTCGT